MSLLTLKQSDYAKVLHSIDSDAWLFVCFCANWCNSCREYFPQLKELAESRKDVRFFWVDIEDHAEMIGDWDIDKFPTILIQHGNTVAFYSCIHPDTKLAERILQSMMDTPTATFVEQIQNNEEHRQWQENCNFITLLKNGLNAVN